MKSQCKLVSLRTWGLHRPGIFAGRENVWHVLNTRTANAGEISPDLRQHKCGIDTAVSSTLLIAEVRIRPNACMGRDVVDSVPYSIELVVGAPVHQVKLPATRLGRQDLGAEL